MTADTVHRIGLSVKKEALLLRDSNRSETQRLIDLINPASLYLDGDLHIVKVRIHPPIPQMRILDREILNNRHGGFQGKLARRRDAGNDSSMRIADFSDDRHCCYWLWSNRSFLFLLLGYGSARGFVDLLVDAFTHVAVGNHGAHLHISLFHRQLFGCQVDTGRCVVQGGDTDQVGDNHLRRSVETAIDVEVSTEWRQILARSIVNLHANLVCPAVLEIVG